MHSKLVTNAAILLFLLVVVLSGAYIARAKTRAVSDTGTMVDTNGGHYVKYGACTYYRQYNDACFEANSVYGDFDHVPHAGFDFYEQSFSVCSYQWDSKRFVKAETIK